MGNKKWLRFLIPGFIFQSVTIGGGYGTGAEIAQYFGTNGLVGGLLSALVTLIIWSVICALTFEFVRIFKAFDYGSMMKNLLGRFGIVYDVFYYLMMFIVLGVINATAASMLSGLIGDAGRWIGIAILAVGIIFLVIKGTEMIEKVLSFWSYILYAVYIVFMICVFVKFGGAIGSEFAACEVKSGWFGNGCTYALYNLVVVPLILYTMRDVKTRKEAISMGLIAGCLAIIPGILLLIVMGANLGVVVAAETPVTVLFDMLNMKWLYVIFEIVLFGTLIETGTGFIKAVTDRLEVAYEKRGRSVTSGMHWGIVVIITAIGICISTFGLTGLIAKGYGTACYGFLILYAIPMVTIGVYKIVKYGKTVDRISE